MASVWKGSLTFGLVNIPVELRTAVKSSGISFRLLHADDLSPVKYERVCAEDGEVVPWNEIVKGYEYAKGKYVVLTDEDFKAAALEQSHSIEIQDFVEADAIDPRYFETPYYLTPSRGGERGYALLREAIRKTGMVGIGKIIIRQAQHLAAIKVVGDALVLELMRFADELVATDDFAFPTADKVRAQEVQMAEQLIASLAAEFDPAKYTDDYRANLMQIIKAKMRGKKIDLAEEAAAPAADAGVVDLMSRLRESLDRGRPDARAGKRGALRSTRKVAAAREKPAGARRRRAKSA
jgi:DNA end-binding protein Ku